MYTYTFSNVIIIMKGQYAAGTTIVIIVMFNAILGAVQVVANAYAHYLFFPLFYKQMRIFVVLYTVVVFCSVLSVFSVLSV